MNDPLPPDHLQSLFFLGFIAWLLLYGAKRVGFFSLSSKKELFPSRLSGLDVLGAFLIFLLVPQLIARPLFSLMIKSSWFHLAQLQWISLFQLLSSLILSGGLVALVSFKGKGLWHHFFGRSQSVVMLLFFPLLAYVIAFPLLSFIDGLCEWITFHLFGVYGIDQEAVRFIKGVKFDKGALVMALFSIVIAAPFIEEILFRGYLQGYLRQRWGAYPAIVLSSATFSLFHFTLSQGVGNFPLLITLFCFALFLGFTYEKCRSLLASMTLHFLFNLVTVIRLMA